MTRPRLKPSCHLLLLLYLLHIHLARAVPWSGPASTSLFSLSPSSVTPLASETRPSTTPAPQFTIGNGNGNETYEPPNLCGYVNYDSLNSYTCVGQNTCLWNSPLHLVGCGSPSSIAFYTSCVPFRQAKFCSSEPACISNPSIIHCSSDAPFCGTARIGPRTDIYSIFACQSYRDFGQLRVQFSHSSQSSLAHIPRFLGSDGNITYATLTPLPISTPTPLPPPPTPTFGSGEVNPATVPGGVFTVIVPVANIEGKGCNATCQVQARERYERLERKRMLAAGIVGGCMVLVAVGFLGWVAWAWRRKRRRQSRREDGGGGGSGEFVMQDVGVNTDRERQGDGKAESENSDGPERTRTWTPNLEET